MKTYSIAEINDLDHGIPIPRFEGRIKKVFDQKSGEGQYGTWWLQNLIVEDGQQEITVTWTGEDAFDGGTEGRIYSFETGYDKKEKPVGIVRDIRTKNGKKYEGVKVDNRSKIKLVTDDQQGEPSAFQHAENIMKEAEGTLYTVIPTPPNVEPPQRMTNAPQPPPARPEVATTVDEARKHLMQSCNLLNLCIVAVDKAVAPYVPEIAQTPEFFQAQVATLFIESSRSGYVQKMPTTPIKNGN